jgi:hypothetical protein
VKQHVSRYVGLICGCSVVIGLTNPVKVAVTPAFVWGAPKDIASL